MSGYFDLPPGRELAARNRRIIADRASWPERAVKQCEMIESYHPDWYPMWSAGDMPLRPERGFYALRWDYERGERPIYGATAAELATRIDEWKQSAAAQSVWPPPRFS